MEDYTYDYPTVEGPPKPSILKSVAIVAVLCLVVVVAYYGYQVLMPTDVVEFDDVGRVAIFTVHGSVRNCDDEAIDVSDVSIKIDGKAVERGTTYRLEDVILNHSDATIAPGEHNDPNQPALVQLSSKKRGLGVARAKDKSQVGLPGRRIQRQEPSYVLGLLPAEGCLVRHFLTPSVAESVAARSLPSLPARLAAAPGCW